MWLPQGVGRDAYAIILFRVKFTTVEKALFKELKRGRQRFKAAGLV